MKRLMIVVLSVLALCVAMQPVAFHAAGQKAAAKAMKLTGTVKSVSGTQLVVSNAGKDSTFMLDNTTKFTGKGLSTKSKGATMSPTDAVHEGDRVAVTYHDMDGKMHAAAVSITQAAMKK